MKTMNTHYYQSPKRIYVNSLRQEISIPALIELMKLNEEDDEIVEALYVLNKIVEDNTEDIDPEEEVEYLLSSNTLKFDYNALLKLQAEDDETDYDEQYDDELLAIDRFRLAYL